MDTQMLAAKKHCTATW